MIAKRHTAIGLGAVFINLLLFAVMERMASQRPVLLKMPTDTLVIDFVRLKREPPVPQMKERVKPKQPKNEPLTVPELSVPSPKPVKVNPVAMNVPNMDLALNIAGQPFKGEMGSGGLGSIQEAMPLIRTAPLYPPSALAKRIEGKVKILFTVTEEGTVVDAQVIESQPKGVFDSTALRAIRHWKFQKKNVDGQAVRWQSVQTIYFKLER